MKIKSKLIQSAICSFSLIQATAATPTETNLTWGVTTQRSALVTHDSVYSIRFPGGTASRFFKFMKTNGFASDSILFASKAGDTYIPSFTLNNVRLKDVAKSLEILSENQLEVELVPKGPESDVNIWRIKFAEGLPPIKTKACRMPYFFTKPKARDNIDRIVSQVTDAFDMEMRNSRSIHPGRGGVHTLQEEKIVVVMGSGAYVEAVTAALEAAEEVAAIEALVPKRQ